MHPESLANFSQSDRAGFFFPQWTFVIATNRLHPIRRPTQIYRHEFSHSGIFSLPMLA